MQFGNTRSNDNLWKFLHLSGKISEMRNIYDMILYQDRLKKKKENLTVSLLTVS